MDRKNISRKLASGFTLIELLVVVGILAVLTGLVLPKFDSLQTNANHAVGSASADDLGRFIQIYKSTKSRLPDGYDSLMDGTSLWRAADPSTTPITVGLHTELAGALAPKLTATTLSAGEAAAFQSAGIYTLYGIQSTSTARPGDRFNTPITITTGTPVAFVNATNGSKIIDHIYRDNLKVGGTSGTLPAGKRLIAFGFGPHNAMVGHSMLEAPIYPNVDTTLIYDRNLVIFEVGATGKAVFKAVTGTDGDLIDDMAASLDKDLN